MSDVEEYTNKRYGLLGGNNDTWDVIISVEKNNMFIVNSSDYKNTFNYLNNVLLEEGIHLDFQKVRANLGYKTMMDSLSKVNPGNSLMFKMEHDIHSGTIFFPVVSSPKTSFVVKGTVKASKDDIEKRLGKSFKRDYI